MVLHKIVRTLRREGPGGLIARLRHRKRMDPAEAMTPQLAPPFRLPGSGALRDLAASALVLLLGEDALAVDRDGDAPTIHVAPHVAPGGPVLRPGDIALFPDRAAAAAFLADGAAARGLPGCAAVLVPAPDCVPAFRAAGLGEGRVMVLPAPAGDALRDMAAGLARWLIAAGCLRPDAVEATLYPALRRLAPQARLCLGLPESGDRRRAFLRLGLEDFAILDAIRMQPGWQGCGWSYASIARAALAQGAVPLTVCEDDMQPRAQFHRHLAGIETYLAQTEWDLFSGLVTDLPETCRIHRVEDRDGLRFVHLDYAIGMVCNIYNRRALERLAAWTPGGGRPEEDTVDVWLSRLPGLRVVTTLPFLAGHDPAATSTIFGFGNRRYESLIRATERRLAARVSARLHGR